MTRIKRALLCDVGNSTTLWAGYDGQSILNKKKCLTVDLYTSFNELDLESYDHIIISSVVPKVTDWLASCSNCHFVNAENLASIMPIHMDIPEQVGADRLVNGLAGYHMSGEKSCLIVDSGTALTFCYVSDEGAYEGGAIFPGMGIASKALNDYTAKIPHILVKQQQHLLGKNTEEAVQIGLYHAYIDLINGLIKRYKHAYTPTKVIGTGQGLDLFQSELDIDEYHPDLIFKGLQLVADNLFLK